jgi:phosphate transport system protein
VHRHFHEQLQELLQRVVLMGRVAEQMIQLAINVLVSRSEVGCSEVFIKEQEVNQFHVEIDDRAVKLTAMQQPMASDARFLFMASKIGSELERIADQAVNICQNAHYVLESPRANKQLVDLPIMAEIAQKMVRDSLTAMINRDVALANTVLEEENKVDALRDQIFHALLKEIDTESGEPQRDISLILIARNVERIGDHATNIAEEVIYWIQGRDVRHGHALTAHASTQPPVV